MSERVATTTDGDVLRGERTWDAVCDCGHRRDEHIAETGAQGSFGGSACERCWECPTFRDVVPVEREATMPVDRIDRWLGIADG